MACWRVLELSEQPNGEQIPQLLVKPVFASDSYTLHLTCLSNIWSEELDLHGIVDRASQEQSPIEVSKQDTAQLAILLDNVEKSLEASDDTVCRITRDDADGITLHTTISLPKPLDSLTWKFHLQKRASPTLKNELILPLLVSSHIQHERLVRLASAISDKDKAIARLLDQYESSNLDLAAAFPVISGLKTGRRAIKREQAARHIPALQPFREDAFKQETRQLVNSDVSTLGLFREALSECAPTVPSRLKSDDEDVEWWTGIANRLSPLNMSAKSKAKKNPLPSQPIKSFADSSGEETEDEFENHSNFKTRILQSKAAKTQKPSLSAEAGGDVSDDDATEDDDDLDAPPKSQSQRSSQPAKKLLTEEKSSTPDELPSPRSDTVLTAKAKVQGFRIGGKAKKIVAQSPTLSNEDLNGTSEADDLPVKALPSPQMTVEVTPKKSKRTFKIGGKGKSGTDGGSQTIDVAPPMTDRTRETQSPSAQPPSSPVSRSVKEETPVAEETPEEKAERRRAELKRKTEEAARKQAQNKKKRRF